jgi:hypothetical protein
VGLVLDEPGVALALATPDDAAETRSMTCGASWRWSPRRLRKPASGSTDGPRCHGLKRGPTPSWPRQLDESVPQRGVGAGHANGKKPSPQRNAP